MARWISDELPSCGKGMGRFPPCSSDYVLTKRIWMVLFSFSLVTVSSEGGPFEDKTGSTAISTCWLWSCVDSEGLYSMIDASTDNNDMSFGFSTSDGLGKSFLYPGGSHYGEVGRLSKTLLASSRKGQWWRAWSPSHSLQGNLDLPFFPLTSFSLVDGVLSTWSSEVEDTGLCKWGDQSLKIHGMQGQSRW